jgi:hypothetical protein
MAEAHRVWHDLRDVLAELPDLEMGQLSWMTWDEGSALLLRIGIWARNCRRPEIDDRFNGPTEIRCQRVTDWALRPVSSGWLHGGPRMVFHDTPDPEALAAIGFTSVNTMEVPHADEDFDPPLRLSLLVLERGFVVAERFEIAEVESPDIKPGVGRDRGGLS